MTPFTLDGGRAGVGGASAAAKAPKPTHAPGATARARRLRKASTLAERLLWADLRPLKLNIRRQSPIGRYIADFACHTAKLVIEIDGPLHQLYDRPERDAARTAWLEGQGYRVIRFTDLDVVNERHLVVERITAALTPPTPALPPLRGKGG